MLTIRLVVIVSIFGALCTGIGRAAKIESEFEQYLASSTADTLIPVLIRPRGTLDPAALKRSTATRFATRAERHRAVVTELKAVADATQPPIIEALNSAQFTDRVASVKRLWIDNAITAMMTPTAIAEVANRPDVANVRYLPPVEFFSSGEQNSIDASVTVPGSAQPGLLAIKADSLWTLGYTGKGRLVASLDTGVDGQHNFLKDKWRGNNGYPWQESWFYPLDESTEPRFFPGDGDAHGTYVMGIMVAIQDSILRDDETLDTVGVAFDAQWITAAAIDISGANILEAMQWLADPDGNPNTEHDVPDAVANPWGSINIFSGCSDVFWNGIDNVEAAGAAMIFAAGNEGVFQGSSSIRNPANRATTMTNAFAVGMVDPHVATTPIHFLSSRGPSDCGDGTGIKPNVVAPGVNIHTTRPRGFMAPGVLGTSFAVPHVAGGIALLREANPNATVEELKTALMLSATDLGDPGPDNTYGHGLINLAAALELLPPNDQPALYIKQDYYDHPPPGTSTDMVIVLRSQGTSVSNVMVDVVSEDARLTVVDGLAPFGDFPLMGDTAGNFADPFEFAVDGSVLEGERLPIRFEISGDGGYARSVRGAVQVGPARTQEVFTHTAGNFTMTVSSLGQFGLHPQALSPRSGGMGYTYGGDPTQTLFEGAFLVGTGADRVSDNARDQGSYPDFDFLVDPGGHLEVTLGEGVYEERTRSAFSDAHAEYPIGLFIEQRTFVDNAPEADDYLIVEYTIHNRSGAPAMRLHAGLYFDWDFPWLTGSRDIGGFDADLHFGWMADDSFVRYRGLAVLTPRGATSYRHFLNDPEIYAPAGDTFGWDGFTNVEKWHALIRGFEQVAPRSPTDGSHLIASGPFDLETDSSVVVAFAIIGGETVEALRASAQHARARYSGTCSCPRQADINGDGSIDNLDLLRIIDILFFAQPDPFDSLCPRTRSDFDSNGFTDAIDLNHLIEHLYSEAEAPCDPCDPTGATCAGP